MRINVPSMDAIVRMVEAGHGISVVPQACVERDLGYGRITAVALDDDWAQRRIELFTRDPRTLSAAAELLLAHLAAVGGHGTPDRPVRHRRAAKSQTS
jgi:DNA-binding transcriptional LysR family regulator